MDVYLRATSRQAIANAAQSKRTTILRADENATYDHMIDLDLSALEPHIYGPFTPDVITPLSKFKQHIIEKQKDGTWSPTIQAAHIGSCSNSSYQDLARSASLAQQAIKKGLSFKTSVSVTPGSTQIRSTLDRDGATKIFKDAGAALLANASGPCISTWNKDRPQYAALETTGAEDQGDDRQQLHGTGSDTGSILSSYNLDISDGMDGKSTKDYFIASTEVSGIRKICMYQSAHFQRFTDSS
jgi:aconitate hydratase